MSAAPSTLQDTAQTAGHDMPRPKSHRRLLVAATLGAITLLMGATGGFLWLDRERVLQETAELAVRGANRLATDLQQSLTVARTAIDQFNEQLQQASSQPFQTPAASLAGAQAELLAALPLPFRLHAIGPQDREIPLIGSGSPSAASQTHAHGLAAATAPGRWGVGNTVGLPQQAVIPLVWRAEPNVQGISGYGVDLGFEKLQRWLESERRAPQDRISLFRMNGDGSATLLARAPRVDAQLGAVVTTAWVAGAEQAPAGVVDVTSQFDGVARRVAYQRLSGPADSLVLVYGACTETALALWWARLPYLAGLALLLAAALGWGGWRLDRSLRALADSERKLLLVLESGNVWDWDIAAGTVRYASAFLRELGYPPAASKDMGQRLYDMMSPEDATRMRNALREHVVHGTPYDLSFQVRDANGALRWFESNGHAFRDARGRATYMAGTTFEITERKALAESQRQTLAQLDTVANASPVLFWTADLQGHVDWVNRCWQEFTGIDTERALGQGWAQAIHPEDVAHRAAAVQAALLNQEAFSLEYRLRHHEGDHRWVMEQCLPRRDADERAVGLIGSCVDISELKRAQNAVRERGAMLESVFEVLQDRLFVIDTDNRFVHYQGVEDDGLYVPPEMFLGKTAAEVVPIDVARLLESELQKARAGQICEFQYALDLPRQGIRQFNARAARIPGSDHCMLLTRDITEPEALRRQRERLHQFMRLQARLANQFINHPLDTIEREIDRALGEIGEFVQADRAYIFRYDLAAWTASNTNEWCSPGIAPAIEQLQNLSMDLVPQWVEAHEKGRPFWIDDVQALPPGELRDFLVPQSIRSLIALPMCSTQGMLGFVGFDAVRQVHLYDQEEINLLQLFAQMLVNVNERRNAEASLRELAAQLEQRVEERTQQLDHSIRRLSQANRELESFAYSVSHDLKSPLRSVEGFAALLLEEQSEALNEEARGYLQRIQRATMHMARLINDLLAYCRIEELGSGLVSLRLADEVTGLLEGMHDALEAKQARVRLSVPPDLRALAHPQGLAMVLRNLVDNAMKFTRPGEQPEIAIEACAIGPLVRLSVRDKGMGFDMKHHDRIFAIFQRLHRPDQIAGTGIGLAMVHKAVERMEGRIWAQSAPGEGATFIIELPRA
jgi:PAS domain S-box-containing protein